MLDLTLYRSHGSAKRGRTFHDLSRRSSAIALIAASFSVANADLALAFGLFGEEEPPPLSTTALPYAVKITGIDDDAVEQALQDTSTLYRAASRSAARWRGPSAPR